MALVTGDRAVSRPHPVLDSDSFGARSRDGASVAPLTVLQYALLHHLAYLPPGKVATWLELAGVLGPHDHAPMTERAIQSHAARLRKRLSQGRWYEPPGGVPWPRDLIVTVHGRGLKLDWGIRAVEGSRGQPRGTGQPRGVARTDAKQTRN